MPGIFVGADIKYTLYIDESGDFESQRGQWVVAGVLLDSEYRKSEDKLNAFFKSVPRDLGLTSIRNFHLTELRRNFGHDDANSKARYVLTSLGSCFPDFHGIAVVNFSKSGLSEREKTYRLMLSDLIALCETALSDGQLIGKLDLVVASRTIDGVRQTSVSDIRQQVIQSLPLALEVDLATRGLLELSGKNLQVHMDYANNSWGLVCADFIANLTYHNRKPQEGDILKQLEYEEKYLVFESAGGFDVRRAQVAERNGDYALAICRWVEMSENPDHRSQAIDVLPRLLDKLFSKRGTTGPEIAFEEILERLWRPNSSPEQFPALVRKLEWFEDAVSCYLAKKVRGDYSHLLFRLRNLLLIVTNHLGNTARAARVIVDQNRAVKTLAGNPEHISRLLDFKVAEAEAAINSLDLDKAMSLSNNYKEIVENYRAVWQLFAELAEPEEFEKSRLYIKTEMSLLRIGILSLGVSDAIDASEINSRLTGLESLLTKEGDLSRLHNYRAMLMLRQCRPLEALALIQNRITAPDAPILSAFDLLWSLRAVNDAVLANSESLNSDYLDLLDAQVRSVDVSGGGHPNDIVMRELALLEFQRGNIPKAKRFITRSTKLMDYGDSEIGGLLYGVNLMHEDHIFGRNLCMGRYFDRLKNISLVAQLLDQKNAGIREVRLVSPY